MLYPWDENSTYIKHPPFFQSMVGMNGRITESLLLLPGCTINKVATILAHQRVKFEPEILIIRMMVVMVLLYFSRE